MENIEIIDIEQADGTFQTHVILDNGNGEFTSMPKSIYDEQQAAIPKDTWVEPQLTK